MPKIRFSGPFKYRVQSLFALFRIGFKTSFRHKMGRRLAPDWNAQFEIGILFLRHQFTKAMALPDMAQGRLLFDSVQTETDDIYEVKTEFCDEPKGIWYHPINKRCDAKLLYFHGGGYSFYSSISNRFASMLAHHIGASVFIPNYRLTPEHPHPAQAEDAMAAWRYFAAQFPPEKTVLIGDSAGGHMALMLLQALKQKALEQPALCIGICPWTDIGQRGESLEKNDKYDLVQGWMTLQFGRWLDQNNQYSREALSPFYYDYKGLSPIYLQAGGREVLRDMIVEFYENQKANGADITLDIWPDMPHDFQAFDQLKTSSRAALKKITQLVHEKVGSLN